ncbi:hypothetical protein SLEP1_g3655 [Rubroshorea leprosula]|uniref:Uncharacterized protein n=1 Tax=Rubroshorea leprosula TaxID=152421 RepID=A0AAV5HWL4_9ROSI|nr:hypothetical protein SLEP1_g3655 [Rubroshorea leprosula]
MAMEDLDFIIKKYSCVTKMEVNCVLETRVPCFSSPPTLCTRRAPPLSPPIFRPEHRQSLGISPYILVLEPRNPPSLLEIPDLRCLLLSVRRPLLVWV